MDLLVVLVLMVLMAAFFPIWPYSRTWGYAPAGITGLLLLLLIVYLILRAGTA